MKIEEIEQYLKNEGVFNNLFVIRSYSDEVAAYYLDGFTTMYELLIIKDGDFISPDTPSEILHDKENIKFLQVRKYHIKEEVVDSLEYNTDNILLN